VKNFILGLCSLFTITSLYAQTNVWQPAPGHTQLPLWPAPRPVAQSVTGPEYVTNVPASDGKTWTCVCNVTQPTITIYQAKGKNTGVAALVFPGGGYQVLAIDLEGADVCNWLASRGITGVLLKYRVPIKRVGPYGESPAALEDAQRALGLIRYHAADWHIDPQKIGVIGFSAGGHMVTATSTHFKKRTYKPVDAADKESCRPDFAIACYPGHLWNDDLGFKLNPNVPVTSNTPPTFIVQAENDPVDSINNSLVYYIALKEAHVPVEMHLYAQGGHAFGIKRTKFAISEWPVLAERWLQTIGMTSE